MEQNYDMKNTENLKNDTGFVALRDPNAISGNNMEEQPAMVPAMTTQIQTPTVPQVIVQTPTELDVTQPVATPVVQMQPVAANTNVELDNVSTLGSASDVIMVDDVSAQPVFITKKIVGNTDTGVNPEQVLRALEQN
jgi:hypothetical protein